MSLMRAKRGFVMFDRDGGPARRIKQGSILEDSDPAVSAAPAQFESLDDLVVGAPVERATSGPGEKRSVDTVTGVKDEKSKAEDKPAEKPADRPAAGGRRSPVKVDGSDLPKGKQDGEV